VLTIDNHKAAQLHFNHVLKSTGETLPIIIRPVCPEKDLDTAKILRKLYSADYYGGDPKILNDLELTNDALFNLGYSQRHHNNKNNQRYAWAITAHNQTLGFLDYTPCSLKANKHYTWPSTTQTTIDTALHYSIYLIPSAQSQGIGGTTCNVANDCLLTKNFTKPDAIISDKFIDNAASMGLTQARDGWVPVGQHRGRQIFGLLTENYQPPKNLVDYNVIIPK
jgi:hypothetical protein